MYPNAALEEPIIGARDWREAAEEVLARAGDQPPKAAERVREATGDEQMTAAPNDEPTQGHKPLN